MMSQCSSQLNFGLNESFIVNANKSFETGHYFRTQNTRIENQMNEFSNLVFSQRVLLLNQLFFNIEQNSYSIQTISNKLDNIDEVFSSVQSELSTFEHEGLKKGKDDKDSTEEESGPSCSLRKQSKLHYKDLFRERMFGVKQYRYRLNIDGKVPQVLYKERNLSLKINLIDSHENSTQNQNALSLHLKVFYSNGEEIENTKNGENFMKGPLNCTLIHGKALFDKVYPREVSRKLDKKKLVFVIYASGMGNLLRDCSSRVDPIEIEPLIIYGVKVITKQNKENKPRRRQLDNEE